MPIPIIVNNFTEYYKVQTQRAEAVKNRMKLLSSHTKKSPEYFPGCSPNKSLQIPTKGSAPHSPLRESAGSVENEEKAAAKVSEIEVSKERENNLLPHNESIPEQHGKKIEDSELSFLSTGNDIKTNLLNTKKVIIEK